MNAPFVARTLPRRRFLRNTGALLALPLLEALRPAFARSHAEPRRLLIVSNNLGFLPKPILPKTAGPDYELPPTPPSKQRCRLLMTYSPSPSPSPSPSRCGQYPFGNCSSICRSTDAYRTSFNFTAITLYHIP